MLSLSLGVGGGEPSEQIETQEAELLLSATLNTAHQIAGTEAVENPFSEHRDAGRVPTSMARTKHQ